MKNITNLIKEKIATANKSNIVIGIDGGQGSGKSYLIDKISKKLGGYKEYSIVILETDDFLVERNKRETLPVAFFKNPKNLYRLFDFDKFAKAFSKLSKANNEILVFKNFYNRKTGKRDRVEKKTLKRKNIIFIGGPYLIIDELPDFDLKIFIKMNKKNRLKNCLKRTSKIGSRTPKSEKELFYKFENFYDYYYKDLSSFDKVIRS